MTFTQTALKVEDTKTGLCILPIQPIQHIEVWGFCFNEGMWRHRLLSGCPWPLTRSPNSNLSNILTIFHLIIVSFMERVGSSLGALSVN